MNRREFFLAVAGLAVKPRPRMRFSERLRTGTVRRLKRGTWEYVRLFGPSIWATADLAEFRRIGLIEPPFYGLKK
jgi:hypothetical protein